MQQKRATSRRLARESNLLLSSTLEHTGGLSPVGLLTEYTFHLCAGLSGGNAAV